MNWKGFGRMLSWCNRDTIMVFVCRDRGKSRNIPGRIACIMAKIRTEHLHNINLGYKLRWFNCHLFKCLENSEMYEKLILVVKCGLHYSIHHLCEKCITHTGSEVLTASVMKSFILWDITPCNSLKVNRRLPSASYWAYSSGLKMEATYSSETSVDFQRTMRRYIPEHRILHVSDKYLMSYA
jgi:hypothetical protein